MLLTPEAILRQAAEQFGTPCFVYLLDHALARIDALRRAFSDRFHLSYSVKANPNRALLDKLRPGLESLDVSSGGELIAALEAGWSAEALTFVGPAKQDWELDLALARGCGCLVVESLDELRRLAKLAAARKQTAKVAVRVNPIDIPKGFGVAMANRATQFGIDEELLDKALEELKQLPQVHFAGFHIYAGAQCLNNESLCENFANYARIFREFSARHELRPQQLIFGSGFGIPYHPGEQPLDLAQVSQAVNPLLDQLRDDPATSAAKLVLELGRYLIGEAGYYLTSVVGAKSTRGREILILDGGMNHQLAASGHLGSVIRRNYPIFPLKPQPPDEQKIKYTLMGPLCTNIDMLGQNVELGPMQRGDLIAVGCSGAYGLTASPVHFITHRPPREILAESAGEKTILKEISADGTLGRPPAWPPQEENG